MNQTDQKLIDDCDRSVKHRRSIELQIARKTISVLRDAGFELEADSGESEPVTGTDDQLIEELFACDQGHLFAKKGDIGGWVFFVFGNDGWGSISDYTVILEPWIAPVMEFADTLS
jgi:hypothetical protein